MPVPFGGRGPFGPPPMAPGSAEAAAALAPAASASAPTRLAAPYTPSVEFDGLAGSFFFATKLMHMSS